MSPWSARRLVADALDVRHRLPLVWAQVVARRARVSNARRVAATTRHLSLEAAARGGCGDGRPRRRLAALGPVRDPAGRPDRGRRPRRWPRPARTRPPPTSSPSAPASSEQGTAGFYVRSTVGVIARLEATVAFLADALAAFGDRDPEDLRRVKAVALLANPVRAVELLAAFAALRADSVDVPLDPRIPTTPTTRRAVTTRRRRGRAALDRSLEPDAVGADGRVRAPGRVHPVPAARLADPTGTDQRRPAPGRRSTRSDH